nr:MAG TPA: hypothetical protein [Caudoviricetes sp.]
MPGALHPARREKSQRSPSLLQPILLRLSKGPKF